MPAHSTPPPAGPAWDHPPSRRGLDRYRRRARLWIWAAVTLFAAVFILPAWLHQRADRLSRTGLHSRGRVLAVSPGKSNRSITVEFDAHDTARRAVILLTTRSPDYRIGQSVGVI